LAAVGMSLAAVEQSVNQTADQLLATAMLPHVISHGLLERLVQPTVGHGRLCLSYSQDYHDHSRSR
jgi:hypothetical protein